MRIQAKEGQMCLPGVLMSDTVIAAESYGLALFSDDDKYRMRLVREWDLSRPSMLFFMLNPSTADAMLYDPTVRRCLGFANRWGYGSFEVRNLFSLRSTNPGRLKSEEHPVGPMKISYPGDRFDLIIAAWGNYGRIRDRGRHVEKFWKDNKIEVHHLGLTKSGYPRHPLYTRADVEPEKLDFDREIK